MKKLSALFLALVLLVTAMPLAMADELPTLKYLSFSGGWDPNKDPAVDALKEKTGYNVEYYMMPSENADQNLLMQISGGESYDVMRISENQYQQLLSRNALMPLNELFEKYGPNLTEKIFPEYYEMTTDADGTIYGIPYFSERASIVNGIVLRKDILEELKLEVPTTPEEFKNVLKAVKAAKPDMIPLLTHTEDLIVTISSGFGFYFYWNEVDGKLVPCVEMPEYKEYLAYMTDLYNEGLLDADIAVNNGTTRTEKFSSGNVFAYYVNSWTDSAAIAFIEANGTDDLLFMDPLYDANGVRGVKRKSNLNSVVCIPKTAAHPEDAVKWMNRKLDEDVFTYITLGEKDVTFTLDENGNYGPIMPIFTELRNNAYWYLTGYDMTVYPDMWMARTRRTPTTAFVYEQLNAKADEYGVLEVIRFCPSNLEALVEYNSSLGTLLHDYALQVIVGVKKLEDHDAFIQEWQNAGGEAVREAYNGWYAAR